jgi:hypothetical protein
VERARQAAVGKNALAVSVRFSIWLGAAALSAACSARTTNVGGGTPIDASERGAVAGATNRQTNVAGAGGAGGSGGGRPNGGESAAGDANTNAGAMSGGGSRSDLPNDAGGSGSGGTGGNAGAGAEVVEDDEIVFDPLESIPDCESGTPGCDCAPVAFTVSTRQSCDMRVDPASAPDGTGSVTVDGEEHIVFAMNRWGEGHVIAWCDSDSAVPLMDEFPGWAYLAQAEAPRIAMLGSHWGCELVAPYTFWGDQMPTEYVDDPAALAADWDVIMLCGFHMGIGPGEAQDLTDPDLGWPAELEPTLRSFVKDQGKGLFLVMDYYGTVVKDADIAHVNSIVRDAGFSIQPTELPWGDVQAEVALECVPDVPIIR